jgi:predicted NodU family carbamoyl transferase
MDVNKSKIILGINISHNLSVCVFQDNKILDFFYEERFNFVKRFNLKDLNFFLISIFKKINFKPDLVIYSSFQRLYFENQNMDEKIIKKIQKQLDNPPFYFNKINHHVYHACSVFYHSNFNEAMSIIIDGGGSCPIDFSYREYESIFYINKKEIIKLYQHLSNLRSLKWGFPEEVEYSNQGYISFKNGVEYQTSSLRLGGLDFAMQCERIKMPLEPGKLMGLSSYAYSNIKYNLNYEYVELAKKIQEKSFNTTCKLIEKAFNYKKIKNFVLSGGYFLNCSNNFKYVKKYPEFNFFVDPDPTDGGTALGACVYYDYK